MEEAQLDAARSVSLFAPRGDASDRLQRKAALTSDETEVLLQHMAAHSNKRAERNREFDAQISNKDAGNFDCSPAAQPSCALSRGRYISNTRGFRFCCFYVRQVHLKVRRQERIALVRSCTAKCPCCCRSCLPFGWTYRAPC
mmetsp:Transcript_56855/g.91989  ORF Transcript_56855/g.91989 Transcript_56855/m.91989 type:complete len:142 (-) Transcript_56855:477-902(-)